MSLIGRSATPLSAAACATAGAILIISRGSNGLGIRYSRPKASCWPAYAAATTSLPEEIAGIRNWDYRFTWLRDASFTLHALNRLNLTEETRAFTRWLLRLSYSEGEALQIMYGIRGERDLPESELAHLSGYRDSRPVRIGNGAAQQKQLDIFGEIMDCIYYYWNQGCFERYGEQPHGPLWNLMRTLIEYVCEQIDRHLAAQAA